MDIILFILGLAGGFFLLVKGSDFFVDGAAGVATKFGIPQIIIGLTIVAMGTSAPEAAVSIAAAFQGNADITIGNIVGSNILNILIILGIASVITPIAVQLDTIRIEIPYMIIISILLLILGLDGVISTLDAVIMVVLFIIYLVYLFIMSKKNKEVIDKTAREMGMGRLVVYIVGGIIAIIIGSKLAVYGATGIAKAIGVSDRFIGLTVVALGTSLPELFTSVTAARKGNADIAIGNIVGSNIFNILFVIGITGLIVPVPYTSKFTIDGIVMIGAGVLLLLCVLKTKRLERWAGICMLVAYAGYFTYLLLNQ